MPKANQRQGKWAVLYIRVSTTEQADGLHTLEFQEKRCREYCDRNELLVTKVFVDPGESARTADRPQFQEMLRYCRDKRNGVTFVVVQDVSRFARNQADRLHAMEILLTSGVLVRHVNEPNVDESASGKLYGNIMGGFAQYYSDLLSERQQDGTRRMALTGRFPWRAPIGYRNERDETGPIIVPDEREPLIRRAFELFSTARYKASDVLRMISEEGLRNSSGKVLHKQRFRELLRNPLYAGWVTMPSDPDFTPVRGLHKAIVPEEVFDAVQAVLEGRKPIVAPKNKINPVVPLRSLVRCAACGTPITGGNAIGRGGKAYPRYWCPKSECLAVKVAKHELEAAFVSLLQKLKPTGAAQSRFPEIAKEVWARKRGDVEREVTKLSAALEEQDRVTFSMVKLRAKGEITAEEFEQARAHQAIETSAAKDKLAKAMSRRAEAETFSRFAQLHLADLSTLWTRAEPEQKVRVQKLLFAEGLVYGQEQGFFEPHKSSAYSILADLNAESVRLVGPPGLEPGTNGL